MIIIFTLRCHSINTVAGEMEGKGRAVGFDQCDGEVQARIQIVYEPLADAGKLHAEGRNLNLVDIQRDAIQRNGTIRIPLDTGVLKINIKF